MAHVRILMVRITICINKNMRLLYHSCTDNVVCESISWFSVVLIKLCIRVGKN
ncbi:hypothetical protein HanIR_Chr01g0026581 [Helianthus annuus]|nr:hypothetical protein HanIR_Chr01g0026581 [Helianthus annuus]